MDIQTRNKKKKTQVPLLQHFKGWKLEEAKARFSEVVKRAHEEPQRVTVHGKDAVVIVDAEEFARMIPASDQTSLHMILSTSPLADIDFGREGVRSPIRDVEL